MIQVKVEAVKDIDDFFGEKFYVFIADDEKEMIGMTSFHSLQRAHKFASLCLEIAEECKECGGTGEVSFYESVWYGEPHQALVGTRKCVCLEENY